MLQIPPNTELDAVNIVISAIGEGKVNTLEGDDNVDVLNARGLLSVVNAEIQDIGWTFNINESKTFTPDTFSKQIVWLPTYLRIWTPGTQSSYNNRGGFIYDRLNDTDQFTGDITASCIEMVPFEELPFAFRQWITYEAARRFNEDYNGDPNIDAACQRKLARAQQSAQEFECDYGGYNIFNNDPYVSTVTGRS